MNTVLITGAHGFIGRHAVSALESNRYSVHAVSRRPPSDLPGEWHSLDLLDHHACQTLLERVRPTHLLHLAWETRHRYYWAAPENLDWIAASLHLIRQFREKGGKRAVLAGTCAEYDWHREVLKDGICRDTTTPCRPSSLYGVAKNATHDVVASFAKISGLSCAWARLFFVFGPYENKGRLIPSMARAILTQQTIELGSADTVRDYLHTADAGHALASLLDSDMEGPVNIASGQGTSFAELAEIMIQLLDADARLFHFGARHTGPDEPKKLVADTSRLKQLAFTPSYSLRSGLSNVLTWWRRQLVASATGPGS